MKATHYEIFLVVVHLTMPLSNDKLIDRPQSHKICRGLWWRGGSPHHSLPGVFGWAGTPGICFRVMSFLYEKVAWWESVFYLSPTGGRIVDLLDMFTVVVLVAVFQDESPIWVSERVS